MILHHTQAEVARDNTRFRVVDAGRGWGKTKLAIEELVGNAVAKAGRRVLYVAPTVQQARDIAWLELKDRVRPITVKANESRLEITIKAQDGGTSLIWLRGWEAAERLRGQEFDFIVIDEIASMDHFWVYWQEVLRPTLRISQGGVLFISTPKGFNHFYDLYNTVHKDFKSFHYTSYDNPYLPVAEMEAMKETMTPDRFAQEVMADFRKAEGLVYKEFKREVHTYEDKDLPKHHFEKLAGIDFGFVHPVAVLEILYDGDTMYVDNELYTTQKTDVQVADYVAAMQVSEAFPDPENPNAIELMRQKGITVRDVVKGKDSVTNGINKVRELLQRGKLKVNKRCINTIQEFESYHYKDGMRGELSENPEKVGDHAMDALRYPVMMKYNTDVFPDVNVAARIEANRNKGYSFS